MSRVLFHSVAPWAGSGYGQQTAMFTPRIRDLGHDVALSAFWGLGGAMMSWQGMPVFPTDEQWGSRTLPLWAKMHEADLVITLMDVWVMNAKKVKDLPLACWCPVDHDPAPPKVVKFFEETGAKPIAMSRFGERMLKDEGFDPLYVPHGVDTSTMRPKPENRAKTRKKLGYAEDAFVIGMVAANTGNLPARKAFPQVIQAFARFRKDHPDAYLFMHTEPTGAGVKAGLFIPHLAKECGLTDDAITFTDPLQYEIGMEPPALADLYSAFDVLASPSYGEGFGIPIVESQSCFPAGTEVIAENPLATFCKSYTGEMVTLETDRGTFESTADHPIWTADGWQSAAAIRPGDRLLYCPDATEGVLQVHAGPIERIVAALRNDAAQAGSGDGRDDLCRRLLPVAEPRARAEVVWGDDRGEACHPVHSRSALSGGAGGRRGHGDDTEGNAREAAAPVIQAVRDRRQHGQAVDRLARRAAAGAGRSLRHAEDRWAGHLVPVLDRRHGATATVPGAPAALGSEGRPDGGRDRIHGASVVAIQDGPLDPAAAGDHLADPRAQYDTVRSVGKRHVRNLPVYNLTTESSTYRVGAGYLVHNCGTPVIVTDWTAMTELCGDGWTIGGDPWFNAPQGSFYKCPSVDEIVAAFEAAYEQRGQGPSEDAREFALQYDAERVMKKYWVPALARLGVSMSALKAAA